MDSTKHTTHPQSTALETWRQDVDIVRILAHILASSLIQEHADRTDTSVETYETAAAVSCIVLWLKVSTPFSDHIWRVLDETLTLEHDSPDASEACTAEHVCAYLHEPSAYLTHALTQALDVTQRHLTDLEMLLGMGQGDNTRDDLLSELPLFQNHSVTPVATGSPMLSSAQALLRHDLWHTNDDGKPVYRRQFSHGRTIEHYITKADPNSQYPEVLAGQAAWQIVKQFGIATAYMHLVFAAYAAAQPAPWQGLFRLEGSDLIKTLGMEKRTDVSKADKLRDIAKQAELLGSLGVWVVWQEGKRDLNVRSSRMWDVAVDIHGQKERDQKDAVPTAVTLTIRPGLWTEKFLNHHGLQAGTALRQFGYLAQNTLQINPYQAELAAKLAVYLTLMSRLRRTYHVQTLLSAVEPAETLREAMHHRLKRHRLKRRWDEALLTLREQQWQLEFDPETYPLAIRPDWARPEDALLQPLPPGYFRQLLAGLITFTPPEPIPQILAVGSPRPSPPPPKKSLFFPLTGHQIRQARIKKGWSQKELATRTGKSQQWVAFIERDKRKIQPKDQMTLRTLLGLDHEASESV